MKTSTLVVALALILAGSAAAASTSTLHRRELRQTTTIHADRGTLRFFRRHRWLLRSPSTRPIALRASRFAAAELAWTRRELAETAAAERALAARRSILVERARIETTDGAEFACIHRHEGAWNANTGNGYYGGLQMDSRFQSLYGSDFVARWGTADRWPVWAQVTAARRARDSGRGYYPWPNTARACGLI